MSKQTTKERVHACVCKMEKKDVLVVVAIVGLLFNFYIYWSTSQRQSANLIIRVEESWFSIASNNFKMVSNFLVKNRGDQATTIEYVSAELTLPITVPCYNPFRVSGGFYIESINNSISTSTVEINAHQSVYFTCVFGAWAYGLDENNVTIKYGESVVVDYRVVHTGGIEVVSEESALCERALLGEVL